MHDNASPSSETPQSYAPVQFTEPLPDWVREEVAAHRDKLPALRKAMCVAILASKGILPKGEKNKDQGYAYTGYASILEAVREPMATAGLMIEQVSCDVETELSWTNNYGTTTVWKWRCIYLITHESGAAVARVVRTITSPGAKCAGIASAACDRLMLTRLMRLAGSKDEGAQEPADRDNQGYNTGRRPEQRPPREAPRASTAPSPGAGNGPPKNSLNGPAGEAPKHREFTTEQLAAGAEAVAIIVAGLAASKHRGRMLSWGRIIRGTARVLPKAEVDKAWAAFHARCAELGLVVNEISAEIKTLEALPITRVLYDPATGEMQDRVDGTLL